MNIFLRDHKIPTGTSKVYNQLTNQLKSSKINFVWGKSFPKNLRDWDLFITHSSLNTEELPSLIPILGIRIINRRERMLLAEKLNIPTVDWKSPRKPDDIYSLFHNWESETIVFKPDSSYDRKGVQLVCKSDLPLKEYDFLCDVFMRHVKDETDTFKIDCCYNSVVSARKLEIPPIGSPMFHKKNYKSCRIEIADEFKEIARLLGPPLSQLGSLYYSFDLMQFRKQYCVIEINTTGISRDHWSYLSSEIVYSYCIGIVEYLRNENWHNIEQISNNYLKFKLHNDISL